MAHGQLELLSTDGGKEQKWVLGRGIGTPTTSAAGTSVGHQRQTTHLTRVVNCTVSDVKRPSQTLFGKSRDCLCWGGGKSIHSSLQWVKQLLPLR